MRLLQCGTQTGLSRPNDPAHDIWGMNVDVEPAEGEPRMDTGNTALPRGSPGLGKSTNDLHDAAKNSAFQQAQELENLDKLQDVRMQASQLEVVQRIVIM